MRPSKNQVAAAQTMNRASAAPTAFFASVMSCTPRGRPTPACAASNDQIVQLESLPSLMRIKLFDVVMSSAC